MVWYMRKKHGIEVPGQTIGAMPITGTRMECRLQEMLFQYLVIEVGLLMLMAIFHVVVSRFYIAEIEIKVELFN